MSRIVSIGSALQDVFLMDHDDFGTNKRGFFNQLELGTKVDIDNIFFSTGGGATNAATTFTRSNHETYFMGSVANDPAGNAIVEALNAENINTSYVSFAKNTNTGYSVLLVTPSGERTILTCRGASSKFDLLNPDDLEAIAPDWIYISTLRGDMTTLNKIIKKAKKIDAKVMLNPGNLELQHQEKLISILSNVDILLVNKQEAKQITTGNTLKDLVENLRKYVKIAIVTDGSQGAVASNGDETYRIGLYEDPPITDATGAGDAFGSGFLASLASNRSFKDSLIFASANSTSVVQQVGSKAGIISGNTKLHNMPMQEIR